MKKQSPPQGANWTGKAPSFPQVMGCVKCRPFLFLPSDCMIAFYFFPPPLLMGEKGYYTTFSMYKKRVTKKAPSVRAEAQSHAQMCLQKNPEIVNLNLGRGGNGANRCWARDKCNFLAHTTLWGGGGQEENDFCSTLPLATTSSS